MPPAASAVHVEGERAYARFRRGEAVTVPARTVVIHRLELERFDEDAQRATLASSARRARTSARSRATSARRSASAAYCATLRRTAIGPFAVAEAAAPGGRARGPVRPAGVARAARRAARLPLREVDTAEAAALRHGRAIAARGEAGEVRCAADGRLVAVARVDGADLRPAIVLEPAG